MKHDSLLKRMENEKSILKNKLVCNFLPSKRKLWYGKMNILHLLIKEALYSVQ